MKILIAVEDEMHANAILDYICTLGLVKNINFKLLHVVEPLFIDSYMSVVPAPVLTDVLTEHKKWATELLDKLEARLKPQLEGGSIEKLLVEDFPKSVIVEEAKTWSADLIVMGSHGRKGVSKFFLGSVSQAVANNTDKSLLIVRVAPTTKG